jgi:ribosomal protein S18 acetylase RimI-like enzyme
MQVMTIARTGSWSMSKPLRIARAQVKEAGAIARLIEPGFARHIAPVLGQVGRVAFRLYVTDRALRQRLDTGAVGFCARLGEALVGYAELRGRDGRIDGIDHLTLLFVAVDLQGRGIARRLLDVVISYLAAARPPVTDLTVNASAYAVPIYHRLGFRPTGGAGEFDGIVATPMRLELDPTKAPSPVD